MQNNRETNDRRYRIIYRLWHPIFRIAGFIKYGIIAKQVTYKEPVLILSNHTTDWDYITVTSHIKSHFYVVCSQHVLSLGLLGKVIEMMFNPIPVFKGSTKPREVMEIMRRVRRGQSILLFPEGRTTHNGRTNEIDLATAQLAKRLKCKVVTFRHSGGFFIQPRWQDYQNKGRLFSSGVVNEYSVEQIGEMSDEELLAHIKNDLYVDAYEEQKKYKRRFRLKKGIEDLPRFYDVCPECHSVDTLTASGNIAKCDHCGFEMTADKYGYFHGTDDKVYTASDLETIQDDVYLSMFENNEFFTDDGVTLYEVGDRFSKTETAHGRLVGHEDRIVIGETEFLYDDIMKMEVIRGGSGVLFGANGKNYYLLCEPLCLNKYVRIFDWYCENGRNKNQKEN